MMSQKSLKNNVNLNDFKRSLLGSILFPAIALVVFLIGMTFPVLSYVTSDEFLSTPVHDEVSLFLPDGSMFSYSFFLLPFGMVICGMMTAIKSFYFMLRKNQVNVFFCIGMSRRTMYINRIVSGVISLFVAVFIPMLIIYITNLVSFGISSHLTSVFLYAVVLFFTCGLAGFSIGSVAVMISGNIFEAVLTCATPTIIPTLIASLATGFLQNFLKGYVYISNKDTSWVSVLSPWGIATNLGADYPSNGYADAVYNKIGPDNFLELLTRDTTPDKFVVPKAYQVDLELLLPAIIWFAVSVVLVVLGAFLFKARKAEHANSFGHFSISRAINGAFVFAVVAYILLMALDNMVSPFAYFLITLVVGALVYFLVQLIMTRKMKTTLKSMAWYGALAGVLAVALVVVGSGFFGTYNKTPDKAEIKSVSAELTLLEAYPHYIYTYDNTEDFVESETDESKEAIIKAFELVKNEKVKYGENSIENITFVFRDKNNELTYREFAIYSAETYYDYLKTLYGSDYFDAILEEYLLNDPPEAENPEMMYGYEMDMYGNIIAYGAPNDSAGYLKNMLWCYSSNNMLLGVEYLPSGEYEQEMVPTAEFVENSEELCKALYKDLTKMTFEQLFHNTSKPIGILTTDGGHMCFDKDEFVYPLDDYGVIMNDTANDKLPSVVQAGVYSIPVYPEMTETIKYLESNGYEINKVDLTVKEVLYTDSPLTDNEVTHIYADKNSQKYKGYGDYNYYFVNRPDDLTMFYNTSFGYGAFELAGYFIDEKVNSLDMLKKLYAEAGHPLKSVTDTAKAEELIEKSVSQYLIYGDNGRYVYVVYEEGPIICYYLPEANVGVLK